MGKYRKCIFCEMQFLRDYISKLEELSFGFSSFRELELWSNLKSMILSPDIKLFLDIPRTELEDFINVIEKKRLKAAKRNQEVELSGFERIVLEIFQNQLSNLLQLKCSTDLFEDLSVILKSDEQLNAFYFTCLDNDYCNKIMNEWGVVVISPNNIHDYLLALNDQGEAIAKTEQRNWKFFLEGKSLPCNSMIIVDNYLLNDTSRMEENIGGIFDAILPKRLDNEVTFHITIFTTLRHNKLSDLPGKPRYDKVQELIKAIRPKLKFSLAIFKCKGDSFHDRTIVTNSMYIGCGAGFDLFKSEKTQKTTTVNIVYPFLSRSINWAIRAYSNLLAEVSTIYKDSPQFISDSYPNYYIGDKNNRLIKDYLK